MKVTIYQTNPTLLDVQANLEEVIDKINHGRENGAHLSGAGRRQVADAFCREDPFHVGHLATAVGRCCARA